MLLVLVIHLGRTTLHRMNVHIPLERLDNEGIAALTPVVAATAAAYLSWAGPHIPAREREMDLHRSQLKALELRATRHPPSVDNGDRQYSEMRAGAAAGEVSRTHGVQGLPDRCTLVTRSKGHRLSRTAFICWCLGVVAPQGQAPVAFAP